MKMRISVSIENEDESAFTESTTREFSIPGVEAFTGSEVFDQVFEQYEREVLEARNGVVKEATEKYVSEVGKKKTQSELDVQGGELLTRPKEYPIEAEAGQLEIDTFEIKKGSRKVFSTKRDVFPETGPRERHKTVCFREIAVFSCCDLPFRKSAEKLNRMLRRKEGQMVQPRTLANLVEREGEAIAACVEDKAKTILKCHDFTDEGICTGDTSCYGLLANESFLPKERVSQAGKELNDILPKERQIDVESLQGTCEDPTQVKALISVDDVLCKKQKASGRKRGSPSPKKKERVKNTVAHIQSGKGETYTVTTATIAQMMMVLVAFLLSNGLVLIRGPVVFFTDGAEDLLVPIQKIFAFLPFKLILDWYHLDKKCQQRLSMAMKGKEKRNTVLQELLAWLWIGKVDQAIHFLRSLDPDGIRDTEHIEKLIGYFSRNLSFIPCYALRQKLGLRVSSNPVEKANDLLVSNRQKHNGMSWSPSGSHSLAILTSLRRNDEHMQWLLHHDIRFQFDAAAQKPAA